MVVDLGWVDFDLGVLPSSLASKSSLAQAELGRQWNISNPSQPNPVHDHQPHPVLILEGGLINVAAAMASAALSERRGS